MIADSERREAARRLRERAGKRVLNLGELLWCIGCDYGDDAATWNRLADLIDPACEAYRDAIFYPATGLAPEHEETVYRCGNCDEVVSDDEGYDPETDLPAYCERCGSRIIGIGELWDE